MLKRLFSISVSISISFAVLVFTGCGQVGLIPTDGSTGSAVSIPRVIMNCQTAHCRTNSTPRINTVITTSACTDATFGASRTDVTESYNCNGTSGCYYEASNWTSSQGADSTIPAGLYNICSCINYSRTGLPWQTCNSLGSKENVSISSTTGLQTISNWIDQ